MVATKPWWDELYLWFMVPSLIVALIVYSWLIFAAYRYRKRPGEAPPLDALKAGVFPRERGNPAVEGTWTALSFLLVFALTVISVVPLERLWTPPKDCSSGIADESTVCVHVTGYQWGWTFDLTYPAGTSVEPDAGASFSLVNGGSVTHSNGTVDQHAAGSVIAFARTERVGFFANTLVRSENRLDLPVGKTIIFIVDSTDVNHGWWVPAFGVKADAIQNRQQTVWFDANEPGVYRAPCAEYCGDGHTFMVATVKISAAGR